MLHVAFLPFFFSGFLDEMRKAVVSRSAQTEVFVADDTTRKCFFRVVFEGRTLQFKLPFTTAFNVLFSRVPVVGDFVWHGIVLDGSLSPAHYNMLCGEENCATLNVVLNTRKSSTVLDDIQASDAVRAVSFRLRLQEEENDALKVEVDELQAQIFSLHRELNNVVELQSKRLIAETKLRDEVQEEKNELLATVRRLEAENDLLRRHKVKATGHFEPVEDLPEQFLSGAQVTFNCVLMDEVSQAQQELPKMDVSAPATVAKALQRVVSLHAAKLPPLDKCMVCVRSSSTGEYSVIDVNDPTSLNSEFSCEDTLYVARMS